MAVRLEKPEKHGFCYLKIERFSFATLQGKSNLDVAQGCLCVKCVLYDCFQTCSGVAMWQRSACWYEKAPLES